MSDPTTNEDKPVLQEENNVEDIIDDDDDDDSWDRFCEEHPLPGDLAIMIGL